MDREILIFQDPEHLLQGIFLVLDLLPERQDGLVLPR